MVTEYIKLTLSELSEIDPNHGNQQDCRNYELFCDLLENIIRDFDRRNRDARPYLHIHKQVCADRRIFYGRGFEQKKSFWKPKDKPLDDMGYWDARTNNSSLCRPTKSIRNEVLSYFKHGDTIIKQNKKSSVVKPRKSTKPSNETKSAPQQKSQPSKNEPEIGYYRINISWIDQSDVRSDSIDFIMKVLDGLGMELLGTDELDKGFETEKTIAYGYNGTDLQIETLCMTVNATLNVLAGGSEFNIKVHSKKIKTYQT